MSEENVEVVRALYEAFERGDSEAPFDSYAADIVWDRTRGMLGGVYRGHDGVRESFRDLLASFSSLDLRCENVVEGAGGCVLATVHERYIGRGSGVKVDRRHYAVWALRDGKVTRMVVHLDRAEALEAVGLSE